MSQSANGQNVQDSTQDLQFHTIKLSDLLNATDQLRKSDNEFNLAFLLKSGFVKSDSIGVESYINVQTGSQIIYYNSREINRNSFKYLQSPLENALVFSSSSPIFREELNEFIRQQKWNENLYSIDYSEKDKKSTVFCNIYKELKYEAHFGEHLSLLVLH